MPILTETEPGSFNRFYGDFVAAYPSVEARHVGALTIAEASMPGSTTSLPETGYLSRNFLLAHWGDEDAQLRQAADFIYTLAAAVEDGIGEPAMVFTQGTPEDVMTQNFLEKEVAIDYGVVYLRNLRHGFTANLDPTALQRQGVKPPYLAYRVMIDVFRARRITADLGLSTCEITAVKDNPPLIARLGRVSLNRASEEVYGVSRKVDERSVVVGKDMCALVLEHLAARTYASGSGTRHQLKKLAEYVKPG